MDAKKAIEILEKYRNGSGTAGEIKLVDDWYEQLVQTGEWQWQEGEREAVEQLIQARILKQINETEKVAAPVHRIHFLKRARWWAAALVIVLLGTGTYFLFFKKSTTHTEIVKTNVPGDVKAPQTNKAMISMGEGETVYLDRVNNGELTSIGNVQVMKLGDGRIEYKGSISEVKYHTLTNPRGSTVVDMMLSDGSHVWLNAGSSVTYPVAFGGNERKVTISGEAYFEISHDANKPFYVSKGDAEVKVLGTHFNVNAFDDEEDIKITLLEGSVEVIISKVQDQNSSVKISPRQQARIKDNRIFVVGGVDIDAVMAWKNGYFQLSGTDVQTIMKQISRWYDVEINYEGSVPKREFGGQLPRTSDLSEVLKILEESNMKTRIEGRRVIVMQ